MYVFGRPGSQLRHAGSPVFIAACGISLVVVFRLFIVVTSVAEHGLWSSRGSVVVALGHRLSS